MDGHLVVQPTGPSKMIGDVHPLFPDPGGLESTSPPSSDSVPDEHHNSAKMIVGNVLSTEL